MNKLLTETPEFVTKFKSATGDVPGVMGKDYEVVVAPSATHLNGRRVSDE